MGSWAPADDPRGAVLVIHENKGLNDWVRSVAGRLAGSDTRPWRSTCSPGRAEPGPSVTPRRATAALSKIAPGSFVADVKSGLDELQKRAPGRKLAVIGFCFGGGLVWQLLASGAPKLSAAVPFYGPLPDDPDFAGSKNAAVLGFYGALDPRVTSSEPAAKAALDRAGLVNELVVEPDADHAFFNDTGARYNPCGRRRCVETIASLVGSLRRLSQQRS